MVLKLAQSKWKIRHKSFPRTTVQLCRTISIHKSPPHEQTQAHAKSKAVQYHRKTAQQRTSNLAFRIKHSPPQSIQIDTSQASKCFLQEHGKNVNLSIQLSCREPRGTQSFFLTDDANIPVSTRSTYTQIRKPQAAKMCSQSNQITEPSHGPVKYTYSTHQAPTIRICELEEDARIRRERNVTANKRTVQRAPKHDQCATKSQNYLSLSESISQTLGGCFF